MKTEYGLWVVVHIGENGVAYARQVEIDGEEFTEVVETVQVEYQNDTHLQVRKFVVNPGEALEELEGSVTLSVDRKVEPEKFGYEVAIRTWDEGYVEDSSPYLGVNDYATAQGFAKKFLGI